VSELGDLLELLYGARSSFRTVRGVLRHRHSTRLTQEAMLRENARRASRRAGGGGAMLQFARGGQAEEPPDLQEEVTRFWFEPPHRLREETESSSGRGHTTVLDGDLWWTYMPDWGATSNVGVDEDESANVSVGGGEPFRALLDPSGLLGSLEIEQIDARGARLFVRARPRVDLDDVQRHTQLRMVFGADAFELEVDRTRGVVLRLAAFLSGEELSVSELEGLVFDEDFPAGTFVFVPPPGEEIRPPETGRRRTYSLDEVAPLAGFRVFEIPELPEGHWRQHVHYSAARERPPVPANVAIFYSRGDGRETVILAQRKAGEGAFGWPGVHPEGPPLEELERDGVEYTLLRGDPQQGSGASVSLDRDGTAIQLQSQELDADVLLDLAASLRPVE
jgi:outer membrane lipoprotein-sorting protein